MLLARIRRSAGQKPEVAAYIGDKLVPLPDVPSVEALLESGRDGIATAQKAADAALAKGDTLSPDAVEFLAPTDPKVYLGLGYNYKALASAEGVPFNKHPELFAKLPGCAIGHGQPVRVPSIIDKVDYEAELGVVIGRRASRVKAADALDYVGGYVPVNDLTAKLIPRPPESGSIIVPLKCADGFGPFGPVLITSDEIGDPHKLTLTCHINGEEKQRYVSDDMVHSIGDVIEYITARITLNPGDLISMGTSLGIGIIKKPPVFLKPNDMMEVAIEGYPPLRNRIEWEAA